MNIPGFTNPAADNSRGNPISLTLQQIYDYNSFATTVTANSSTEYFQTARNLPGRGYVPGAGRLADTMTFTVFSIGVKPYYNDQTQATGLDLAVLGNTELTFIKNQTATKLRLLTSSCLVPGGAWTSAATDLPSMGIPNWDAALQLPEELQIVIQQGDTYSVQIKNSEALTLSAATELQVVLTGLMAQYTS
jgi:hypothetical protein